MGSKVSVPGLSPEERALQQQQAELLQLQKTMIEQQNAQNKILLPFLAEQEGFSVTLDDNGTITGITRRDDPSRTRQQEIQRLLEERSLAALRGELPVDPALEQELQGEEQRIRERLAAQFGPGYETSSPGIETLGDFFQSAEALREGVRTGHLTLAEQLGLTREQQGIFSRQSSQDVLRQTAVGDPLQFAGAFGQVAKGYGQAQIPFMQQRGMQLQANMLSAQGTNQLFGAGIGALGAIFSDPDMKEDLVLISKTIHGIPIYIYTRKDTGERMIGVLSTDVEEVFPGAVFEKGGYQMVQYEELV